MTCPIQSEYDLAIVPFILYLRQSRGGTAEVLRRLNALVRKPVARPQLDRWLHPDRAVRREPQYGVAVKLLRIKKEMMT